MGLGIVWLSAYKSRLKANLEHLRLRAQPDEGLEEVREEFQEALDQQTTQIAELHERLDFAERLLASAKSPEATSE